MQINNIHWWTVVITLILTGFIVGWTTKPSETVKEPFTIKIHDTLKATSVQYKIIPGTDYNIDSLITVINQFWKDSLKNLYGKGLFQTQFHKDDELGKRIYTMESRIPLDPESNLVVDESFIIPKRTLCLVGCIGNSAALGLKYYVFDAKKFSVFGFIMEGYVFNDKCWKPNVGIECEYKF